ncbi:hypothetical protein B0H12DRAFT_835954 [Mycena haematopus]|nr:hypothetical protein B0H12DRAFT_835954 [Mycena haematopus]
MSSPTNTPSASAKPSRPSFMRSKTMPALRRALSMPSIDKSLASLRASSSKGLRQMSSFGKRSNSAVKTSAAGASTESIPVFTTPDYTNPTAASPAVNISPLTRPLFRRARTMPAPIRALTKLPSLKVACCAQRKASTVSAASSESASVASMATSTSTSSSSTSTLIPSARRRSLSVSSIESFSSTEDRITFTLQLRALPSTLTGLLASLLSVILILIFPAMAAKTPRRTPPRRPYERESILTNEQKQHAPRLLHLSTFSRLCLRISKAYRRTLRRAARARRASSPHEALTALFKPITKRVRARTPTPVNPTNLASDIPRVVYSSPIALPLPKGPAPVVLPPRSKQQRNSSFTLMPTVTEEEGEILAGGLCTGW